MECFAARTARRFPAHSRKDLIKSVFLCDFGHTGQLSFSASLFADIAIQAMEAIMPITSMNDVTLDRIDFEKLKEQAKAKRAGYLHQHGTAALGVVGSTLREHRVIAVVAILVISFGVKMFFLSAPTAEATNVHNAIPSASVNVLQMQRDVDTKSLPVQKMNDKTFIFTDEE